MNIIDKYKKDSVKNLCIVVDPGETFDKFFMNGFDDVKSPNATGSYTLPEKYREHWNIIKDPVVNELHMLIDHIRFKDNSSDRIYEVCIIQSMVDNSVYAIDLYGIEFINVYE